MISELVTIEQYFGRLEAVMTLEDMIRRYGKDAVDKALADQQIEVRCTFCRVYAMLTDRARFSQGHHAPVPAI